MQINITTYLIICPLIFFAGFVDAVAGGGGLISLPAYLAVGLPPASAAGSNKFSASFGTLLSTVKFFRSGNIHMGIALLSALFSFVGSSIGANIAILIGDALRYIILVFIPLVAIVGLLNINKTRDRVVGKKLYMLAGAIGLAVGLYDGLVGPGTGTFLIMLYTAVCGYSLRESSGNAKVVNLSSNISALIVFVLHGQVLYALAIPAAIFGMLGNYVGVSLAIKNGKKIIQPILYIVLAGILIKIIYDILA